jgi:hypothetical protein
MSDPFASWRSAVNGGNPGMQEEEPWCGYFRILDRRGDADGKKREWVPCAIWQDFRGNLVAEVDGDTVPVRTIWPYCGKHPISFQEYTERHIQRTK